MMSNLNTSLLSLKNAAVAAPPSPPQTDVAQSKRFAQIMAKTQATAPRAVPPVQAKPVPTEKLTQGEPSSEASRAEANARINAKTAARSAATRALIKVPSSEPKPQTVPNREAGDGVPSELNQTERSTSNETAALNADMAAWMATMNSTTAQATSAAPPQSSGELISAESELATRMTAQAAGQDLAQKHTQNLREEADVEPNGDAHHRALPGMAGQRAAADLIRARPGSDGAGQSGRDGQQAQSHSLREANEASAASRASADMPATAPQANAVALLSKETGSVVPNATGKAATEFSALMASNLNAANMLTSGTADTLTVSLPTPVNAPEFREALGVQVSLLARDGVQTAELHLNPADMGPVSIQIIMEGNQARVDFGADVAATRAAIEAGMPELASALLDAGFTLAGGGVSQHAKGQAQPDDENRQGRERRKLAAMAPSAVAATAHPTPRRVQITAGGVDLFA